MDTEIEELVKQNKLLYLETQSLKKQVEANDGALLNCKVIGAIYLIAYSISWFFGLREFVSNNGIASFAVYVPFILIGDFAFGSAYSRECHIFFSWLLFAQFDIVFICDELALAHKTLTIGGYLVIAAFFVFFIYLVRRAYSEPKTANSL